MARPLHVGIIADLHDHLVNFSNLLARVAAHPFHELWIAGDVGMPETLADICQQFAGPIRIVPGNVETDHGLARYARLGEDFPHLHWSNEPEASWQIDDWFVSMTHQPRSQPHPANPSSQRQLVISGHTHRPRFARNGPVWSLNPGTLGGIFLPATYVQATFPGPDLRLERLYPPSPRHE